MEEQGADAQKVASGPGVVTTDDVGLYTIANTLVLDSRFTMAYAAGINDDNPAYFDDVRPGGLQIHPGISFSLQWASRFRPDQKPSKRAAPYGVHASTDLLIHRPFRAGEAITNQGRDAEAPHPARRLQRRALPDDRE